MFDIVSDFGANTDCFLADDWEIVPEPPKTMTFQEAVEHIEAGTDEAVRAVFEHMYIKAEETGYYEVSLDGFGTMSFKRVKEETND